MNLSYLRRTAMLAIDYAARISLRPGRLNTTQNITFTVYVALARF